MTHFWHEIQLSYTVWLLAAWAVTMVLARKMTSAERWQLKFYSVLVGLHCVLVPVAMGLRLTTTAGYRPVHLLAVILAAVAAIGMVSNLLFTIVLPAIGLRLPRILRDVVTILSTIVVVFGLAAQTGYNLTGIIATSAVVTAVLGLSAQDTLGNIMAGLSLELENSFNVGDWIQNGAMIGRVIDVRWRSTTIETRNWEIVVIPNSVLVRNPLTVLGTGPNGQRPVRHWVYFNVDFRYPPSDVIAVATDALTSTPLQHVADSPRADCIIFDFHDSFARYAVRYWINDILHEDIVNSAIRTRLFFALRRAGIPLSMPAHAVFLTEESSERKAVKSHQELQRRLKLLSQVDYFRNLTESELQSLVEQIHDAPFARGEVIAAEGSRSDGLYVVVQGEVGVMAHRADGSSQEVARLGVGKFFGEISLMTGEARQATVVALTDVLCFRIDLSTFEHVLRERPDLAEEIAGILATRRMELESVRESAAQPAAMEDHRAHFLARIKQLFRL